MESSSVWSLFFEDNLLTAELSILVLRLEYFVNCTFEAANSPLVEVFCNIHRMCPHVMDVV